MLTREENELITRVGPGTPMGETLRRYWMPALMSVELPEADSPPVRVRLLGEDLVAFRDTSGRVGLLDELCPHRLASLWLGRNEEDGLRCVYHGWKFDVDGACVEQMNEPESFAHKVRVTGYPTVEQGGLVWAYMGPAAKQPPAPNFEWALLDPSRRNVTKVVEECNWVQALEGGIDTSHAPILHRRLTLDTKQPGISLNTPLVQGSAPRLEVDVTEYGYQYFGIRDMRNDRLYARGYVFIMPFTQLRPQLLDLATNEERPMIAGHMWAPRDDVSCVVYNFVYSFGVDTLTEEDRLETNLGNGPEYVDEANGYVSRARRSNNWNIDRTIQRHETFTGIRGINAQDRAVQESMGPIVDRTREHLGPADRAIIAARQLLIQAVRTVQAGGDPRGADDTYWNVRAQELLLPKGADWRSELLPLMDQRPAVAGAASAVR